MNLDKFTGCIYGLAIGDALGMPMETMSRDDIKKKIGLIIPPTFLSPSMNPHIFSSLRHLKPGFWTDDTQLTLATMEAFIESDGSFDMNKIAQKHIEAYQGERRGWGKSTRNACQRLAEGASWKDSGEPNGAGNGIMMKIAPLGLRKSVRQQDPAAFLKECITYARMTHLGTQAIVAGVVHAAAIAFLVNSSPGNIADHSTRDFLGYLRSIALMAEKELPTTENKISEQFNRILSYWRDYIVRQKEDPEIASRFGGGTSYAYHSLGLSYALFAANPTSFSVVWQAACAGGDTDSNASIVGSLYGALNGASFIPKYLLSGLERCGYLEGVAKRFFQACNK
ncbi:MAG: ADP-ribosylglycohydrolase family protein [bacterium]|nr:ADP-ribosylglycohydrolase family protein [bacterium]